MKALILAAAELHYTEALKTIARQADYVVAADAGIAHAAVLEVRPDLIVGDFDSATEDELRCFPTVPRERHPAEKDWLDLELAIDRALATGAQELILMGVLGDRLDQSLAAITIAARLVAAGQRISIYSGKQTVLWLHGFESRSLVLAKGQIFSVLSFSEHSRLTIKGAKYPLDEAELAFGVGLGVSNEVVGESLDLIAHVGLICVIVEHHLLPS